VDLRLQHSNNASEKSSTASVKDNSQGQPEKNEFTQTDRNEWRKMIAIRAE
jgi:hypothetical protein